jgi:hypothetical protein
MNAGIGTAAADDLNGLIQYSRQCRFQLALDGIVHTGQTLPAPITGAVIAQIKTQIPHIPSIPFWLPAHYPLKTETFR